MEITWRYVKPITSITAISDIERQKSIMIPADLKDIIKKYNNGRPSLKNFDVGIEKEKEFKKLLSFNKDDIENIYGFLRIDTKIQGLLPFASDPSGNLICLYQNKIYYWRHESDTVEYLSDTFTDFLNKLY